MIGIQHNSTECIKIWIYNAKEIMKKVEKLPKGSMQRFFEV